MKKTMNIILTVLSALGVISFWINLGVVIYYSIINVSASWHVILMVVSLLPSIIKVFCCGAEDSELYEDKEYYSHFCG